MNHKCAFTQSLSLKEDANIQIGITLGTCDCPPLWPIRHVINGIFVKLVGNKVSTEEVVKV